MSTTTAAQARAGIISQLIARTGIHTTAYVDSPSPPCLMVRRTATEVRTDFSKKTPTHEFTVTALCPRTDEIGAQEWLDACVSRGTSTSIMDALEYDRTLGAVCDTLQVGDPSGDRYFPFGELLYLGFEVTVTVIPTPG